MKLSDCDLYPALQEFPRHFKHAWRGEFGRTVAFSDAKSKQSWIWRQFMHIIQIHTYTKLYKYITSSSKSCKIQLFASKFSWGSGLRTWRTSWWRCAVLPFSRKTTGNRWSLRNCAAKCILKSTHEYCCCCCCHYILLAPAFACSDFVNYLDDITCAAVSLFKSGYGSCHRWTQTSQVTS